MIRAFVLAGMVMTMGVLAACSDDEGDGDDQNAGQIGSLSENATYAMIDDGGAGLYDYLAETVTQNCTEERVSELVDEGPEITAWKQIDNIELTGNDARATVIVLVDGEETEQPWSFTRVGDSWRISGMPGLEECVS
jgi:hypothetical protein